MPRKQLTPEEAVARLLTEHKTPSDAVRYIRERIRFGQVRLDYWTQVLGTLYQTPGLTFEPDLDHVNR